uniref:Uncharacterized protein n=1 Tax=Aegilops tauschii subsp. strangulata TaxID=200361 RepID=A0A453GKE2_AEGTS
KITVKLNISFLDFGFPSVISRVHFEICLTYYAIYGSFL